MRAKGGKGGRREGGGPLRLGVREGGEEKRKKEGGKEGEEKRRGRRGGREGGGGRGKRGRGGFYGDEIRDKERWGGKKIEKIREERR
ncbi:hypothetical protein AK79_23125 [Salmonella enterica subsp. enterica serovar Bareilly str. CFSAN001089]|nr:hypothetical protein AK79_23125 [Salmonella enterica subsp. enterica serovar Bareilly str. CFSAN001089]